MPEENKNVDIDTSGPEVDVEIENKQPENEVSNETTSTDNSESDESLKKPDEQLDVQVSETETETKTEDSKKELNDYSDGVKKRIAKLTKKMREAERREQAATDYAKNVLAEKEKLTSRLTTLDTGYVSEMENRINSSMEAAAAKLSKAREDGDIQAEINATKEISKLGYEEARLAEIKAKNVKPVKTEIKQPVETFQQQSSQPINPDPKAQTWAGKNSWFGQNEAMTYTAFGLHQKLTEEEGYDPQSDEYYVEIDKRIRLEFPHKFGTINTESTNTAVQNVASASRSTAKTGRKTVRLSPSQVAIAKKLGVPLQEYAKQLNITKEV
jgi:hypothetical protein|tara:strand:+ start:650 stop:1630 length:981 start_codon:yes stop_codon:yes gene_type:complete